MQVAQRIYNPFVTPLPLPTIPRATRLLLLLRTRVWRRVVVFFSRRRLQGKDFLHFRRGRFRDFRRFPLIVQRVGKRGG